MGKTDLEKSHSKVSNFKLTLMCLLLAIGASALWIGAALICTTIEPIIAYIALGAGAIVSILAFLMIGKFTR